MNKIDQQIARALECARAGDQARAEKIVRAILRSIPPISTPCRSMAAPASSGATCARREHVAVEVARARPDLPPMQMNFANCLARTGKHEEALQHFDEALRLRPEYPQALYNRALSLKELGRIEEATNDLQEAVVAVARRTANAARLRRDPPDAGRRSRRARRAAKPTSPKSPRRRRVSRGHGMPCCCAERTTARRDGYFEKAIAARAPEAPCRTGAGPRPSRNWDDLEEAVDAYGRAIARRPRDPRSLQVARRGSRRPWAHPRKARQGHRDERSTSMRANLPRSLEAATSKAP